MQQLDAKKQAWVDLQDAEKAKLLRRCIACTVAVCDSYRCAECSNRPQPPQSTAAMRGHEMLSLRASCTCWSYCHGLGHCVQVSQEAAETATKVKGSWGSGIAEEHIAWVPIVSGLREYAEASILAVALDRI